MNDYGMQNHIREINIKAAQLARKAADKYTTEDKPRFVAGSIGPTNKTHIDVSGRKQSCIQIFELR